MRPVHFMMIYLYMALYAYPYLDLDVGYIRYFPYFWSSHSRLLVSKIRMVDILVKWAHYWLARSYDCEIGHTVSCLEPSRYTVKVESVLIVSLHGWNKCDKLTLHIPHATVQPDC
jgi:hypothetical protein